MDLSLLKYIVTIAEEKKLSKAAEKLHLTSSALSQCIKKLESEIGISLFEKLNSHTFQLTNGGRIYVEASRKILEIKKKAYRELEDVQHYNRGSFVFGCSPKRGLAMLANVYPEFHKAYPNIHLELKEAYLNTLYDLVINGSVDIAVLTPISEERKNVNLEFLDQEEIVFAIPKNHPLSTHFDQNGAGTISFEDLRLFKDDNWMMSTKDTMLRDLTDSIFEKAGFYPEKVLLETSSTTPHIVATEEGIAVSLVPHPKPGNDVSIQIIHLEPRQYRNLYAVYRRNYILSESQRYFIDLMGDFYDSARSKGLPPHRMGW